MPLEIERKFRLLQAPPAALLTNGTELAQHYLGPGEHEVRARRAGATQILTIKRGDGLVREEWEQVIPEWVFRAIASRATGSLAKIRHSVPVGDLVLEIDRFRGPLEGLWMMEVEFASVEASQSLRLPDWAAGALEVTSDRRYRNSQLVGLASLAQLE